MNQLSNIQEASPQSFALQDVESVAQASEAMPYEPGWFARSKFGRTVGALLAASLLTGCAAASASQSETNPTSVGTTAGTTASAKPFEFSAQPSPTTTPNTTSALTTPSTTAIAEQPAPVPASPFEPVPRPEGSDKFEMAFIKGGVTGTFATISSQNVASGSFFELPEPAGCPWTERSQVDAALASGDIPEGCDWSETSQWISNEQYNATYPTSPATGRTYVGMHNCIKHVFCPGDELAVIPDGDTDTSNDKYTVTTENQIQINVLDVNGTRVGEEIYQVCGVGPSEKHLKEGERSTIPTCEGPQGPQKPDLIVTTCIYDTDEATGEAVSTRNTIAVARLVSSHVLVASQG